MKYQLLFVSLVLIFLFSFCNAPEEKTGEDVFNEQMDTFKESMEEIDENMDLVTLINEQIGEIESKVDSGLLSREQGNRLIEEINETYRRELARLANINPARTLPQWAVDLGLSTPEGLILDPDYSSTTSSNDPEYGYNSVKLVYRGNYEKSLKEADKIARKAGIPMSTEYAEAYEKAEKYPSILDEIRGIAYMNYDFDNRDSKNKISITVDENGVLIIYAIDEEQRKKNRKSNE